MTKTFLAATLMSASLVWSSAQAQGVEGPAAAVEKMLSAIGGRQAWATLTGTVNDSQQNRPGDPTVVRAVITMDFEQPRFRIDTIGPGLATTRVVNGKKSWRRTRDGAVEDLPADVYADDMRWYGAHVYRTIHRLAADDKALSSRLGEDGRLEVIENGERLIWFRLDAKGEPFAFGFRGDDKGTICGPWEFDAVGIKHPIWVSNTDGTWRANARSVTLNPKIDDAFLSRPRAYFR